MEITRKVKSNKFTDEDIKLILRRVEIDTEDRKRDEENGKQYNCFCTLISCSPLVLKVSECFSQSNTIPN